MKAFAENPFFFFVDNAPPIFSVDASEDATKIVELFDTGCDARMPTTALSRNSNQYHASNTSKVRGKESWRPYSEGRSGNKFCKDRFHGHSDRIVTDTGKLYFIPKEDENDRQRYWRQCSAHDEFDDPTFGRKPEKRDFRTNWRLSEDRTRSRHWNRHDLRDIQQKVHVCDRTPQNFRNERNTSREDRQSQARKRPKTNPDEARPHVIRPNSRKMGSARADYQPEAFDSERTDHWQRLNTFVYDLENPIETSKKKPVSNSRNARMTSSPTSNDISKRRDEAYRSRGRTCSPPCNRRKRTRSCSKSGREDFRDFEEATNKNLVDPPENSARYVDRAVDRDSLSDILNVTASFERVSNKPKDDETKTRRGFWEFIPLEDENGQEKVSGNLKIPSPVQQNGYLASRSYPLTKRSMKTVQNVANQGLDGTVPSNDSSSARPSSGATNDEINRSCGKLVHRREAKLNSNDAEAMETTIAEGHDKRDAKVENRFAFGWTGRSGRYSRRSNSKTRPDSDDKKVAANGDLGDRKAKMGLAEKTAAQLKRKLEGSKTEEASSSQFAQMTTEKKIRHEGSKLPIRIGSRLRAKNPIVSRLKSNLKARLPCKESSESPIESSGGSSEQSSVRSRTKPKVKPSVAVDSTLSNDNRPVEIKKSVAGSQKAIMKLLERNIDGKLIDGVGGMRFSPRTGSLKDEKLRDVMGACGINDSKMEDVVQRKRDLAKDIAKESFKEKCVFRLNEDENIVCSNNHKKDQKNLNILRAAKPAAVRSRL